MNTLPSPLFDKVARAIADAHLIAFDGCHKIYLAMDEIEAEWFRENYEVTFFGSPNEMLDTLYGWWKESCPLKFVQAVSHDEFDPNAGFESLIEQGAEWEEEICFYCEEAYCEGECQEDDEDDE